MLKPTPVRVAAQDGLERALELTVAKSVDDGVDSAVAIVKKLGCHGDPRVP